ncbi:MAG: pyridoxine 5'-phosphate synthase [Deltaproteobacteria bacterium]|nr:pyridoxine 5'-phosphate synthase [Deltaproteobacteria bacterium]
MRLMVNIDHVATLREARRTPYPDPIYAAGIVEMAGASGIIVHLREDRRHIKDRDLKILREVVRTKLNLEMAATDEMIEIATKIKPDMVTLVPERREELTTEGGLDVKGLFPHIKSAVERIKNAGIKVSLFVDPEEEQIEASRLIGAQMIEIHTGRYADALREEERIFELERIKKAAKKGKREGLKVHAGHGLNYDNVFEIAKIPEIEELSIGHSIIARAVFVGLDRAVRDMIKIIEVARREVK